MKVTIKNLQKRIPVNPKRIKEAVLKVCSFEGIKKSGEITICFQDDKRIKELNLRYLGKNSPTDVMVFDITSHKDLNAECSNSRGYPSASRRCPGYSQGRYFRNNIFADIVISTDTAISNAKIFKTTPLYELYLYIIHGLLHLSGYSDKNARQRRVMEDRAQQILARLALKRYVHP